jgi:hypothetical protein
MSNYRDITGTILGIEMELNLLEEELEALSIKNSYLIDIKERYDHNKNFLKLDGVIVSIMEYRRINIELNSVNLNIKSIKTTISKLEKRMLDRLQLLDNYNLKYEKEVDRISNNLLLFKKYDQ